MLKRVLGKGRGEMGAAELDAAVAWLERNRLADHLHLLEGDGRYAFEARRRAGQWRPPQGRAGALGSGRRSGTARRRAAAPRRRAAEGVTARPAGRRLASLLVRAERLRTNGPLGVGRASGVV